MHSDTSGGGHGSQTVHDRLVRHGIEHEIAEHAPTYSAGAEARALGAPAGTVAKTVVAVDHDRVWLAVVPASRRVDLQRLRERTGASRHLRLATEPEIARHFADFDVGATPPLGKLLGVPEVIDALLLDQEVVVCAGGDHEHALRLSPHALLEAAEPDVADIAADDDAGRRTPFSEVRPS